MQDKATTAWNFHTALYYKAGGVPWRLARQSARLTTCYVGVSFFKSAAGDKLMTSVLASIRRTRRGVDRAGWEARAMTKMTGIRIFSKEDAFALFANGLAT